MSTDLLADEVVPPVFAEQCTAKRPRADLALLTQLEASLQRSREALLAMDLSGIERGTFEQATLAREVAASLRTRVPLPASGSLLRQKARPGPAFCETALDAGLEEGRLQGELFRSAHRILQASRLQAALLARARGKLRVLANVLAGPSALYGPPLSQPGALVTDFRTRRRI